MKLLLTATVWVVVAFMVSKMIEANYPSGGDVVKKTIIRQKLDHFDPENNNSWLQPYYKNTKYYLPGGPVFLLLGNQSPLKSTSLLSGHMMQLARKYGAATFALQLRFIGDSQPTQNTSTENLIFYDPEQALADTAHFIRTMQKNPKLLGAKWIVFGSQHGGALATWMRLKYPTLVVGAVASGASLLAKANYYEYLELVTEALTDYSVQCTENIQMAFMELQILLETYEGAELVEEYFKICDLDQDNTRDINTFYKVLTYTFSRAVENSDCDAGKCMENVCEVMSTKYGTPILRFARLSTLNIPLNGCWTTDFLIMIDVFKDVSWSSTLSKERVKLYHQCSGMGAFITTDSDKQVFGKGVPLQHNIDRCSGAFGPGFNLKRLEDEVKRINDKYGGLEPNVTNVVFVQGSRDPWRALRVNQDLSPSARAIVIEGATPGEDMNEPSVFDSKQLIKARRLVDQLVEQWLQQESWSHEEL